MDVFPEPSRPHLQKAITHYERIAALLRPAITGEGGVAYKEFMGDLEKQKEHAETVLKPVKAQLLEAAAVLEQALVHTLPRMAIAANRSRASSLFSTRDGASISLSALRIPITTMAISTSWIG